MSNLSLERLKFDPTDPTEGPLLGSYILSEAGEVITHTTDGAKERLDVSADIAGLASPAEFGIYAEDSAHTTADLGQFVLAVQSASQGALGDDGDYVPFQVDSDGRLRTVTDIDLVGDIVGDNEADTEDPLKVGGHAYDQASVLGAVDAGDKANLAQDLYRRVFINDAPNIGIQVAAVSVDDTAGGTNLSATPLAGRTRMLVQNQGTKSVWVGPSGVTTASGVEVGKGDSLSLEIGEAIDMYAISAATETNALRVLEWG